MAGRSGQPVWLAGQGGNKSTKRTNRQYTTSVKNPQQVPTFVKELLAQFPVNYPEPYTSHGLLTFPYKV